MSESSIEVATASGVHSLSAGKSSAALEGHEIASVVHQDGVMWAIVDDEEIWRRGPDAEWQRVASSDGLTLRALLPLSDGLLVGSAEAHLFRCCHGPDLEPLMSFEFAPGRDDWFTPWGGPPDVRSLAVDAADRLFVNVHVGGVLRSDDGGGIWEPTGIDIHADVHEIVAVADHPDQLLAATGEGVATSRDAGATWSLDDRGLHAAYCRAVAVASGHVLVSASDGPDAERAALYRGNLGEGGFEKCVGEALPEWFDDNIDTGCVAMRGDLAAFGTRDGRVFLSEDQGVSWVLAAEGLPRVFCLELI